MSEKVETETALGEATQLCLESYYALGGGGGLNETVAFDADDAPERVYVPHELPDAAGLEQILRAVEGVPRRAAATNAVQTAANRVARDDDFFGDDAKDEPTRRTKKKSVRDGTFRRGPVLRHGSELPPGLPSALASLARANAAEAARKAADAADAAASLAATLGVSRGGDDASLVVEGIDISHLAGANTSASVVVFVDGAPAPERHRRYEIETGGAGVAKGDDPAAVREAMAKRIAAARRAVSGKRAAAAAAAAESGARVPGALPDLALIDGGAAQLVAAARACLDAGVEVTNARFSEEARNVTSSNAEKKASGPFTFSVALASLAKGRVSGEESVFVPRAVVDASGTIVDFTADRLVVGPGAAATRAGKAAAADGPGLRLLRAVRDESHAVALGAHRSRRRASLFREMRSARDDEASVATG
jgi:excinuclease UvrABC nuclease subunit